MKRFIQEFQCEGRAPDGSSGPWFMTSVVVEYDEFREIVDALRSQSVKSQTGTTTNDRQFEWILQNEFLPLVVKGTKTEWLFHKYDIKTQYMGVMVRGAGMKFLTPNKKGHKMN